MLPTPITTPTSDAPDEKPTLMIVDDEEGPRQSLRVVFKDDYNLLLCGDGSSAIELARTQRVDVAVLDIRMAGMSGLEVLEQLKGVDPSIEVVMMTAFETNETIRHALRLRACDYITKPFDIATIRQAVSGALQRRTLSCELETNAERLNQLKTELDELKVHGQIVEDRSEIYASVIHDINGPLTIMSGLIQSINQCLGSQRTLEGEDLEFAKDRLRRVTRQVTSCIDVSRRYLALLRRHPAEKPRVWVNQVLGDLGDFLRFHPANRSNQVLIQPLDEDVMLEMHGTDLIQILQNLSLNALQCGVPQTRVEIRGQFLNHELDLGQFQDGAQDVFINRCNFLNQAPLLALSVQDNGPGIAPEILPRVFEQYFSGSKKHSGAGLGLCIVQRLLHEARGACHAHTRPGQGTIFTLYIPAHSPKAGGAGRG